MSPRPPLLHLALALLSLLTLLPLTHATPTAPFLRRQSSTFTCPVVLPTGTDARIVGGVRVDPHLRSHLISFHWEGCGGTLLSPRWGLTAAHCNIPSNAVVFFAGDTSDAGLQLPLKAVYKHPKHDTLLNDISLVEFAEDVPSDANFVFLNDNPAVPEDTEFVRSAGWGHTNEFDNPNTENRLYQVDLPVVSTDTCKETYTPLDSNIAPRISPDQHICAGYKEGLCDSCKADSGGPIVVYDDDGSVVQVGLISFGLGCARPGIPGGYTRISSYLDWIKSVGAVFQTKSTRKPVFLADLGGEVQESQPSDDDDATAAAADSNPPPGPENPPQKPPSAGPSAPASSTAQPQPAGPAPPAGDANSSQGGAEADGSASNPARPPSSGGNGGLDSGSSSSGDIQQVAETSPEASTPPDFSDNSGSVVAGDQSDGDGVNVGAVVGGTSAVLLVVAAVIIGVLYRRRAAARSAQASSGSESPDDGQAAQGWDTDGGEAAQNV